MTSCGHSHPILWTYRNGFQACNACELAWLQERAQRAAEPKETVAQVKRGKR